MDGKNRRGTASQELDPIARLNWLKALIDDHMIRPRDITPIEFQLIYGRERTDDDMAVDHSAETLESEAQGWFEEIIRTGIVKIDPHHIIRLSDDELRKGFKKGRTWLASYIDSLDKLERVESIAPDPVIEENTTKLIAETGIDFSELTREDLILITAERVRPPTRRVKKIDQPHQPPFEF